MAMDGKDPNCWQWEWVGKDQMVAMAKAMLGKDLNCWHGNQWERSKLLAVVMDWKTPNC